jgi:hypothetical protein
METVLEYMKDSADAFASPREEEESSLERMKKVPSRRKKFLERKELCNCKFD